MDNMFHEVDPLPEGISLHWKLGLIRSAISLHFEIWQDYVTVIGCGLLEGKQSLILEYTISVPPRSNIGVMPKEIVALSVSNEIKDHLLVYPMRKDFPRLPHMYLSVKGKPCGICLFNGPSEDKIYNESIINFILRVGEWLRRAACGDLHLDDQGMEPSFLNYGEIVLDLGTENLIQRRGAISEPLLLHPVKVEFNGRLYIEVSSNSVNRKSEAKYVVVPFIVPPSSRQRIQWCPINYCDFKELLKIEWNIDFDHQIRSLIEIFLSHPRSFQNLADYSDKELIVLVVVPRLNSKFQIVGHEYLSFCITESIENLAIYLGLLGKKWKKTRGYSQKINPQVKKLEKVMILPLKGIKKLNCDMARNIAGIDEKTLPKITAIGLGAHGSQVVMNLARQGFSRWLLADDDPLLPHNMSRHALSADHLGKPKSIAMHTALSGLMDNMSSRPFPISTEKEENPKHKDLFNSDCVLDCSASNAVLFKLAYQSTLPRILSSYYCGGGFVSVLIAEDKNRDVRIDDIDLQLKVWALEFNELQGLFKARDDSGVVYGSSCSDITTIMSQDLCGIHAGVISREIKDLLTKEKGPRIFVNNIDHDSYGIKVNEMIPERVVIHDIKKWQVRISQYALNDMVSYREQKLPNETGGVLIGWINMSKNIIYIGKVLPAPIDSIERPYSFVRGKKELHKSVLLINTLTNNDLYYVGEWHSHPSVMVNQGSDDVNSHNKISALMSQDGFPGTMVIVGEKSALGCYVNSAIED